MRDHFANASKYGPITLPPPQSTNAAILRPHIVLSVITRYPPLVSYHILPRASHLSHGQWHRLGASLRLCFKTPRVGDAGSQQCCQRCRGESHHAARPLRCVASLAHTVDRFWLTLLLLFSPLLSICWITGCFFGGAMVKRWTGTGFGRICGGSAAGCLQAAWRASLCFPLSCSLSRFTLMHLNPASLTVTILNSILRIKYI